MSSKFFMEQRPNSARSEAINDNFQVVAQQLAALANAPGTTVDGTDQLVNASLISFFIRVMTEDTATTFTLPSLANTNPTRVYIAIIKNNVSIHNTTVAPFTAQKINGSTASLTLTPGQGVFLIGFGGLTSSLNWYDLSTFV